MGLLEVVTRLASRCSQRVSRAARKLRSGHTLSRPLLSRRTSAAPAFLGGDGKKIACRAPCDGKRRVAGVSEEAEEGEVWRRTILMGDKCQPLDFPGVIYYDADGRQLSEVPPPRSPLRSPLPYYLNPVANGYGTEKIE